MKSKLAPLYKRIDWKRIFFRRSGAGPLFLVLPDAPLPDAWIRPGKHFRYFQQGKAAIGLFLMAGIWWVFEVVPIGVTSIAIGALSGRFLDPQA